MLKDMYTRMGGVLKFILEKRLDNSLKLDPKNFKYSIKAPI